MISHSQNTLASALGTTTSGTDGSKIPPYLNNMQSRRVYDIYTVSQVIGMQAVIDNGLRARAPMVLRIRLKRASNGFGYTTKGHFLNKTGFAGTNYLLKSLIPVSEEKPPSDHGANPPQDENS